MDHLLTDRSFPIVAMSVFSTTLIGALSDTVLPWKQWKFNGDFWTFTFEAL